MIQVWLSIVLSMFAMNSFAQGTDENPWQERKVAPAPKKRVIARKPIAIIKKAPVAIPLEKLAPAPIAQVVEVPENPAAREPASASVSSSNEVELNLKTQNGCFVVTFDNPSGTLPACSELLKVSYTKRNCQSNQMEESGDSQALVDCSDSKRLSLRFRTAQLMVSTTLLVVQDKAGRKGVKARFLVQNERADEQSSLIRILPEAAVKPTVESKPEESPLKFKFSGYTSVEYETVHGFGFAGINQLPNIPEVPTIGGRSNYSGFNILSNLNFEVTRDQTTLTSVLEVGELYFGDSGTGGARTVPGTDQRTMKSLIELRNFFLTHEFTNRVNIQGGIMPLSTDPRGFVYTDNVSSFRANYKADLYDGYVYFGEGFKSDHPSVSTRPTAGYNKNENVAGVSMSAAFFDGLKGTLFGTYYRADNLSVTTTSGTETAQMRSYFTGTTLEFGQQDAINGQFTAIGNWNQTVAQTSSDGYMSYLLDGKLTYVWERPRINFTVEGLMTPGTTNGSLGNRKTFQSNSVTHYIFNIAGSDGWDDAPGSARDYVVGKTSNQEGMQVLALTVSSPFTKKFTAYARGGILNTAAEQAVTHSTQFGSEYDCGASYQMSPSTSWQLDLGEFMPGQYFGNHVAPVYLGATKIKFSF